MSRPPLNLRAGLAIAGAILLIAAVPLYILLDPATATFFLAAGLIVSLCAACSVLLGAYTRNKAIARRRELEEAEQADADDKQA